MLQRHDFLICIVHAFAVSLHVETSHHFLLFGCVVSNLGFFALPVLTLGLFVILLLELGGRLCEVLILSAQQLIESGLLGRFGLGGPSSFDWLLWLGNGSRLLGGCGCETAEGLCVFVG